jgi:hypothetical protein
MRRSVAALLLTGLTVLAGFTAWPAVAQTGPCQLAPVFMMLRDLVGRERVGECTSAVIRNDAGELSQQTTAGSMTFRPSDLVTQFSDGQTTWLFGPRGLESRASSSRLPWETATGNPAQPGTGTGTQSITTPPPAPSPTAQTGLPIKLDGDASATTRPFELAGGDYRVAWEAERQKDNPSCYVGARLRRADSQNPGALLVHTTLNTSNDRTSSGETRLFAVAPGRYVLDVTTTGCSWKITLQLPR